MSRGATKDPRSRQCDAADARKRLAGSLQLLNVSGQDRTGAIRRATQLVDFAREVLQR
jgi:hypothetical protein